MKIEGFLIDFDGVVVKNSPGLGSKFIYEYINKYTPISYGNVKSMVRLFGSYPQQDTYKFIFSSLGIGEHLADFSLQISKFEDLYRKDIVIDGSAEKFIVYCKNNGIMFKIFSLAGTGRIMKVMPYINKSDIYSLEGRSKADSKTFSLLEKELGIDPARWVLIDDDPFSLRSAKMNGMFTIMMKNDLFRKRDYSSYRDYIDLKVRGFSEIIEIYFGR